MIEAIDLAVRRRGRIVLDAVSFDVRPGQVTGVLGGTGAGKTTLLRRMVELERGAGETLFDGRPYRSLRYPMREVGVLLEPGVGHPQRTVRGHLNLALATDRRAAQEGTGAAIRRSSTSTALRLNQTGFRPPDAPMPADRHGPSDHGPSGRGLLGRDLSTQGLSGYGSSGRDSSALGLSGHSSSGRDSSALDSSSHGSSGRGLSATGLSGRDLSARGLPDDGFSGHGLSEDGDSIGRWRRLTDRFVVTRTGSPAERIDAVLDIVGLTEQADTRLADLTDGMATRLGIAVALLGDPNALLFDAPERGLEPEGVAWLGALLRAFTGQGRAALITGSDTETLVGLADRLLLLDSGYLVGTRTAEEVLRAPTGAAVIVRSPQIVRFAAILAESGARSAQGEGACLEVRGLDRARVGDLAYRHGIPVHELSERFTGSDPGDVVLAACSGRSRPIVPFQGFPEAASPETASEVSGILASIVAAPLSESEPESAIGLAAAEAQSPLGQSLLEQAPPEQLLSEAQSDTAAEPPPESQSQAELLSAGDVASTQPTEVGR